MANTSYLGLTLLQTGSSCRTAMRVGMKSRRLKPPVASSAVGTSLGVKYSRVERHRHHHWMSFRLTHENVNSVRISPPAFYEKW